MSTKREKKPLADAIWFKIKNHKVLAILIVLGGVVIGLATFSNSLMNLFRTADDLIPDGQNTDVVDSKDITPASSFENYFNTNFEISENEESDIVNLSKDKISIDFSINNKEGDFKYTLKKYDDRLIINPFNDYLLTLKRGGPISPMDYYYTPFDFQFPALDFKIINNSTKSLFFTKAVFRVSKSRPDQFPVIMTHTGYGMRFPVENIGWGKVYNCKVVFNLVTPEKEADFNSGYEHEWAIGDFEEYPASADLTEYFKKEGVDPEIIKSGYISSTFGASERTYTIMENGQEKVISGAQYDKRIRDASGPFTNGSATIFGEIRYEGKNASGKIQPEKLRFIGVVHLGEPGDGIPMPPSFIYDLKLELDKDNYIKEIPLSQTIKPNEADRFNIKISAPKSSRHQFSLTLFYNENKQFLIPDISLNYFMSRADSSYIDDAKSIKDGNQR